MTTCVRCGVALAGFGVIHGMIATVSLPDDGLIEVSVCYVNGCRDAVLAGKVNYTTDGVCARCGTAVPERSPAVALLTTDVATPSAVTARMLAFDRANGCADIVLAATEAP